MSKPDLTAEKDAVIETCLQMNALGINQGTSGNVSLRVGDIYLLTASGIPYEAMETRHIVEMDLQSGYRGPFLPSSEWRMHQEIYRARPEAGAVVHTHSTYATALSCLRRDIPAVHYMIAAAGGTTIRCADYATFGTAELCEAMVRALDQRKACLLANHGMICFGAGLDGALRLAVEIESLAKQYFIACQAGDPVILDDDEMHRVLARFRTYGKQPGDKDAGDVAAVEAPARRD